MDEITTLDSPLPNVRSFRIKTRSFRDTRRFRGWNPEFSNLLAGVSGFISGVSRFTLWCCLHLPFLLPLHLTGGNTFMYYIPSLFYHGFAQTNYAFSYHLHRIAIIHGIFTYLASLHSCRDRDAGSRGVWAWAGARGRRRFLWTSRQAHMHLLLPILDQLSICVLFAHELPCFIYMYQCLIRTYLMHYQPWLEHSHLGEYDCVRVTNYMLSLA